jgi:1-acyl-sn-glycerol-3-phosphate acyltransferase
MKKIPRYLYVVWACGWFIFFMLIVFPFVFVASFWGKIKGGNFVYRLLQLWADFWFPIAGIRTRMIYEEKREKSKQYVFVSNHISYLDAAFIIDAIRQPFRPLGKIEIQGVPIFGFIYKVVVVVVDRSSPENRSKSIRELKDVIKKGISILIFPEGTFNETRNPLKECYDGAFRLAIETQTPIKPVLFIDTYDRMRYHELMTMNPGKCRAVFLHTIPVEGLTLKELPQLKQQVLTVMETKLREYKASWIREETPVVLD